MGHATVTVMNMLLSPHHPGPGSSAKGLAAERWAAPRLSLFDSLKEGPSPERAPPQKKGYLLKWDLDITRFHTEDLVCRPWHHPCAALAPACDSCVLKSCELLHTAMMQRDLPYMGKPQDCQQSTCKLPRAEARCRVTSSSVQGQF